MRIFKTDDNQLAFEVAEGHPLIVANIASAKEEGATEADMEAEAAKVLPQLEDPFVALVSGCDYSDEYPPERRTEITHEEAEQLWADFHS